jgi:hypothetical protein
METLTDKNIAQNEHGGYILIAAGAKWEDATSYSRGQRGKKQPNAFELNLKELRIYITSGHVHYRGTWIMKCQMLDLERILENCSTATEAAEHSVKVVKDKIKRLNTLVNHL